MQFGTRGVVQITAALTHCGGRQGLTPGCYINNSTSGGFGISKTTGSQFISDSQVRPSMAQKMNLTTSHIHSDSTDSSLTRTNSFLRRPRPQRPSQDNSSVMNAEVEKRLAQIFPIRNTANHPYADAKTCSQGGSVHPSPVRAPSARALRCMRPGR